MSLGPVTQIHGHELSISRRTILEEILNVSVDFLVDLIDSTLDLRISIYQLGSTARGRTDERRASRQTHFLHNSLEVLGLEAFRVGRDDVLEGLGQAGVFANGITVDLSHVGTVLSSMHVSSYAPSILISEASRR